MNQPKPENVFDPYIEQLKQALIEGHIGETKFNTVRMNELTLHALARHFDPHEYGYRVLIDDGIPDGNIELCKFCELEKRHYSAL